MTVTVWELKDLKCDNPNECTEKVEFVVQDDDSGELYVYCRKDFLNVEADIAMQLGIYN